MTIEVNDTPEPRTTAAGMKIPWRRSQREPALSAPGEYSEWLGHVSRSLLLDTGSAALCAAAASFSGSWSLSEGCSRQAAPMGNQGTSRGRVGGLSGSP